MAGSLSNDKIIGIVLIVLGILAVLGKFSGILAILLIVFGILILVNVVKGSTLVGVVCIVAGIVLLADWIPDLRWILEIGIFVVGIILIIVGVLKLMGKSF